MESCICWYIFVDLYLRDGILSWWYIGHLIFLYHQPTVHGYVMDLSVLVNLFPSLGRGCDRRRPSSSSIMKWMLIQQSELRFHWDATIVCWCNHRRGTVQSNRYSVNTWLHQSWLWLHQSLLLGADLLPDQWSSELFIKRHQQSNRCFHYRRVALCTALHVLWDHERSSWWSLITFCNATVLLLRLLYWITLHPWSLLYSAAVEKGLTEHCLSPTVKLAAVLTTTGGLSLHQHLSVM